MISLVPREEVPHIWQTVGPMIDRAIEYYPGRMDSVDVFADILQRHLTLWVSLLGQEIIGCAVTRIYQTPLAKVLSFEFLAGDDVDTWLEEGADVLNRYAYDEKCAMMECRGRFGWVPRLKKLGWESRAVFFERTVINPTKAKRQNHEEGDN